METIKLRQRKKNFLIVHPMKNIWLGNIHRMPKYMYEYLEINNDIENSSDIYKWTRLASIIINGGKFINFDGEEINSQFQFEKPILCGCWASDCNILNQKQFFDIQNVFNNQILYDKPYKYTQCWMFAAILQSLCEVKGIKSRVIIGKYAKIDINKNFIYDEMDSIWNFHVWNEIWYPEKKKWYSIDCCPNISMEKDQLFVRGPIDISNNDGSDDYKYFKHLTTGKDVEIYTYKIKKLERNFDVQKIILNDKYRK